MNTLTQTRSDGNGLATAKPDVSETALFADYGAPRFFLLCMFVLAAGVDIRTRDLGWGGPASNPLEVMCVVAICLLLADTIVFPRTPIRLAQASWQSSPYVCLYGAWVMVAGVVGLTKLGLSFFVFRNLVPAFLFFSLMVYGLRSIRDCRILLFVFLFASLPNMALGVSQYFFNKPYPMPLNVASAVKMDIDGSFVQATASGLFNHPNGLSVFLLPVFLTAFGFAFIKGTQSGFVRLFSFGLTTLSLALLYLTRAKGAWAWGLFGIAVLMAPAVFIKFRRAWVWHLLTMVAGIAALTIYSLVSGGSLKTMQTRVNLWDSAWQAISHNAFVAVFGSGQDDVWYASAQLSDLQYANAHNVFLNQAVYFGVPGMVFYIGIFVWGVRCAQMAFAGTQNPQVRQIARICLAVLLAIAGQYFFEPAAESSGLALECLLFAGLASLSLKMAARESQT